MNLNPESLRAKADECRKQASICAAAARLADDLADAAEARSKTQIEDIVNSVSLDDEVSILYRGAKDTRAHWRLLTKVDSVRTSQKGDRCFEGFDVAAQGWRTFRVERVERIRTL